MRFQFKLNYKADTQNGPQPTDVETGFSMNDGDTPMPLKTFDAQTFVDRLFKAAAPNVGLLPPAVRWVSADRKAVVFERPPATYFIEVAWERKELAASAPTKTFEIPVPWTVYVAYFDYAYNPVKVFCYTRPEPITQMSDHLYLLPMFNIYMDSSLCNPVVGTFEDHPETLSWGVQEVFNMVWNSGFNLDLYDTIKQAFSMSAPCDSNRPGLRDDAMVRFLLNWQDLSLSEALKRPFPVPSIGMNGYDPPKKISVEDAISILYSRMAEEGSDGTQDVISWLVNEFSF